MRLKHKVRINIADKSGNKQEVLQSEHRSIPKRLLTFLFGEFCEVLVLTPGESVKGIFRRLILLRWGTDRLAGALFLYAPSISQ